MIYRKIGGIHWFAIGRIRIAICAARRPSKPLRHMSPKEYAEFVKRSTPKVNATLYGALPIRTYVEDPHNRIIF